MSNYDDILDVKAETPAEPPKNTRPQWQIKQQQNREAAYQITDAAIEEFTKGTADVKRYLDVQSRFLSYSVRNTLLVMKKNPDAFGTLPLLQRLFPSEIHSSWHPAPVAL